MLWYRVTPLVRTRRSIRFASQLHRDLTEDRPTTPGNAESLRKPSSILSRLSDKTQSRVRRDSDTRQQSSNAHAEVAASAHGTPRPRATSFVSARSAERRDYAAEKWFTGVRELDISKADQLDNPKLPLRKTRRSGSLKQHEMRPRTDLNRLFALHTTSAASLRIQVKKELGGDYASYLPDGYADPYQLPIDYARLVLGRNKHIPLNAQTGALNIIEEAIRGKAVRQGKHAFNAHLAPVG